MPRNETKVEEHERRFFVMEGNMAQLRDELGEMWGEVLALHRELREVRRQRSVSPRRREQHGRRETRW